jgi:hypothetical protein
MVENKKKLTCFYKEASNLNSQGRIKVKIDVLGLSISTATLNLPQLNQDIALRVIQPLQPTLHRREINGLDRSQVVIRIHVARSPGRTLAFDLLQPLGVLLPLLKVAVQNRVPVFDSAERLDLRLGLPQPLEEVADPPQAGARRGTAQGQREIDGAVARGAGLVQIQALREAQDHLDVLFRRKLQEALRDGLKSLRLRVDAKVFLVREGHDLHRNRVVQKQGRGELLPELEGLFEVFDRGACAGALVFDIEDLHAVIGWKLVTG